MSALRRFAWAHPEWWSVALCAVAWAAMADHGVRHWGHTQHCAMGHAVAFVHWMAMVAAMMLPLLVEPLRVTAFHSLRARRHRAMLGFLVGFASPWAALGAAATFVSPWPHGRPAVAAAVAFAAAAAWTATPLHRWAQVGCHRMPTLCPSGWRADADCVRAGAGVGVACVVNCAPLMLACAMTGHALPAMVGGAAISWIERRSFRPRAAPAAAGALLLAAGCVLLSV